MKIGAITNIIYPKLNFKGNDDTYPKPAQNQDVFEKSKEQIIKDRIAMLFEPLDGLNEQQKREEVNLIYYNLKKDKTETKYWDMLLRLVENEDFFPEFLFGSSTYSKINNGAKSDLDMIIEAEKNNKNFEKTAVLTYRDDEQALLNAQNGEVFCTKDSENIKIKHKDSIKELFMGRDNYRALFYPLERFTIIQGISGNCFILATLDAIYSNPDSRVKILECFKENPNGTISINMGGYERKNNEIVEKDPERYTVVDFEEEFASQDGFLYSTGAGWAKGFELIFKKETQNEAKKHIENIYEKFKKSNRKNGAIEYNGYKYYKDEVQLLLGFADSYLKNPDSTKSQLVSLGDMLSCLEFSQSNEGENFEIDIENKQYSKYYKAIEKRYENYMKDKNKDSFTFDAIVPLPLAKTLIGLFGDDEIDAENIYVDGGAPKKVFEKLGFDCKELSKDDDFQELGKILKCKNFSSKYLATAHADKGYELYGKDLNIIPWHSYSLEVRDEEEQREYIIKDPHNTLHQTSLTYDEVLECFDDFTFGIIES